VGAVLEDTMVGPDEKYLAGIAERVRLVLVANRIYQLKP